MILYKDKIVWGIDNIDIDVLYVLVLHIVSIYTHVKKNFQDHVTICLSWMNF